MLLDGQSIFGAAGASLLKFVGGIKLSLLVLMITLVSWIVIPTAITQILLRRQDI
jgi:hypothetical protein